MNNSMRDDFKRDGLVSQLVRRIGDLEAFEREFRLKQFGSGGGGTIFLPFGVYTSINPMSVTSLPYAASIDRDVTFIQWGQAWFVDGANSGAAFWTIYLRRVSDNSTINSFSTAAGAGSVWTLNTDTTWDIGTGSAADILYYVRCEKTGAPGNLYLGGPLLEVTL